MKGRFVVHSLVKKRLIILQRNAITVGEALLSISRIWRSERVIEVSRVEREGWVKGTSLEVQQT